MRVYYNISDFNSHCRPVATVGVFDGVHAGHKEIIDRCVNESNQMGCESTVVTFEPHPRLVLGKNSDVKLLQSLDEKLVRFRQIGVGSVIIIPFTKEFAETSPIQFIKEVLVDKIGVRKIISGHDHFFGKGRTGDYDLLKSAGEQFDFEVEQVPEISPSGLLVNSTAIRLALLDGRIAEANFMLGYNYTITGEVIYGNQIGKTIHFPTANINPNFSHKLIPANGVYTSLVKWKDTLYTGMSNIGFRPTINGRHLTIEVHILGFDEDIYFETISLSFLDRIRDEKKFNGLPQLEEQLRLDKEIALKYFAGENF